MANIIVAGNNLSGEGVYHFFKNHHNVLTFDPWAIEDQEKIKNPWIDVAIMCIDTPPICPTLARKQELKDLRCDTSLMEEVINWCGASLILIESAIDPGTTDRIRESTGKSIACVVCCEAGFVFGGQPKETKKAVELFMGVSGHKFRYIQTTAKNAESFKYISGAFKASEIKFINQAENMCKSINVDYHEIREIWRIDNTIDHYRTVPKTLVGAAHDLYCSFVDSIK